MPIKPAILILIASVSLIPACDRGTPAPTTSPATQTAMEKAEQDLKAAGSENKQTADRAATEAQPALDRAKIEARDLTHRAAEKISDLTAPTQPATQP